MAENQHPLHKRLHHRVLKGGRWLVVFTALLIVSGWLFWMLYMAPSAGTPIASELLPGAEKDTAAAPMDVPPAFIDSAEEPPTLLPAPSVGNPALPPLDDTLAPMTVEQPRQPQAMPNPYRNPNVGPGARPGRLMIPVDGIDADELYDTFTQSRSQGRAHNAIDIIAPRGTPVLAATGGRIARKFFSDKGGLTIYQYSRDSSLIYYYAHLDQYAEDLEEGAFVRPGDVLGYVGDSGNAQPGNYHLHFAIWKLTDRKNIWDGEPINPYPLLITDW